MIADSISRFYCHPKVNGVETVSNHNILPNPVKDFFKSKSFCCYEYDELNVETEETMFQLVQRGIALTPAEKMRAMSTEWATFTKQYEDDYPMIVNCKYCVPHSRFHILQQKSIEAKSSIWLPTYFDHLHHDPRSQCTAKKQSFRTHSSGIASSTHTCS